MKTLFIMVLSCFAPLALASQVVTLEDGRTIQLNDDFTWHYVQPATNVESIATPAGNLVNKHFAAPVITKPRGAILQQGSDKPSLQLSDSGIDVVLGAADYQNGKLRLPTAITNQSSQSVISVELQLEVLDQNGTSLLKQKSIVWQSIKRMADTYLRPKSAAEGKTIEIDVPKADSYQLIATISQVETR